MNGLYSGRRDNDKLTQFFSYSCVAVVSDFRSVKLDIFETVGIIIERSKCQEMEPS
jgi:hypothetical protein